MANLIPSQVNLASGNNTFSISQDSVDADVHISSSSGNAVVYFAQPLTCSSSAGILASTGDVKSVNHSLETVGASVSTFSSSISDLQTNVTTLQAQVSNLISVINTAFSLSLS